MFKNKIDVIVVLGGGLKKDKNGWRTTNFDEGDNFGAMGDRLRVLAGFYSYKKFVKINPEILVVVSGGKGQLKDIPDAPTVSAVLKKELLSLGIPEKAIWEENNSGNTYQQLRELNKLVLENKWNKVAIFSNRYHLPRLKAMIEYGNELENLKHMIDGGSLNLVSAEEVLLENDKEKFNRLIKEAYGSEVIKRRIVLEQQGVEQIKSGVYKLK